jgi:hypothetical protein
MPMVLSLIIVILGQGLVTMPLFLNLILWFFFLISNRNIIKSANRNRDTHEIFKRKVYLEGEKKNKKIIKTNHQGATNTIVQVERERERERKRRIRLLQFPLVVLEISIISFSPKALQKARGHHLPYDNTRSATTNPPGNKQINQLTRHNPRHPKATEKSFHKAQTTS